MIGVTVRKNKARHFLRAQMLARKSQCRGRGFLCGQGIDHNPARLALNQGHVGQVKAP